MAKQRKIKKSEAKVLTFLRNADKDRRYTRMMSIKLHMDYGFITGILSEMKEKGWISGKLISGKKFYHTLEAAPSVEEVTEVMLQ